MERYAAYKDSGTGWLGDLPSHWELCRISALYCVRNEKVSDKNYAPLSVTMQGVVPQLETAAKTQDGDNRKLVKSGDFVINSRSDRRGACGISEMDGSVTLISNVLAPKDRRAMSARYYEYLFRSEGFADEFYHQGTGIVDDLWTTNWSRMKNILVTHPSLTEQRAIADYLDAKTAEIDALVADCEREVALLREYRKALISEAVTKGLDPAAPMKDSGVEWIGKIPEGWDVIPLRRCIVRTGNGITRRGDYDEDGALVLKLRNINNGAIDYGFQNRMQLSDHELDSFKLDRGDFLFVRVNGSRDLVGKSAIFEGYPGDVAYNDHIIRISFSDKYCIPRLMLWYLQSEASRREIDLRVKTSAGQFTVSSDDIKECLFVMPPLQEQIEIASFLDIKTTEIDTIIEAKQSMIDKLREYHKSLVSEAVTGKFKVSSLAGAGREAG